MLSRRDTFFMRRDNMNAAKRIAAGTHEQIGVTPEGRTLTRSIPRPLQAKRKRRRAQRKARRIERLNRK